MKYYLVKLLTNTQGQDGSSIAVYSGDDALEKAKVGYHQTLAAYINAQDVYHAVVSILNDNGDCIIKEIVNHIPEPEPEPEEE